MDTDSVCAQSADDVATDCVCLTKPLLSVTALSNQNTNSHDLFTPLRFTTLHEYNQLVELLKTTTHTL